MLRRTTWILLGVLLGLVALTLYLQRSRPPGELDLTPTATTSYLLDIPEEELAGLAVTNARGNRLAVQRAADGSWRLDGLEPSQADPNRVSAAVRQLAVLPILTDLETPPVLANLGLEPPAFTLTLSTTVAARWTLAVGDQTPTGSGYYVQLDGGQPKVVSLFAIDTIVGWLTDPPLAPTPSEPQEPSTTLEP